MRRHPVYPTTSGDIDVIVAEGVDAELQGRTVLGNRKVELAPVRRLAGTPHVVVHAKAVFGDLTLLTFRDLDGR